MSLGVENTLATHRDLSEPKLGKNAASRGRDLSSKVGVYKATPPPQSGNQLAVEPVSMPFRAGEVVAGKYEIIKLIGTGGMGFVVVANHWPGAHDTTPDVATRFATGKKTVRTILGEKHGAMGWDMRAGFAAAQGGFLVAA